MWQGLAAVAHTLARGAPESAGVAESAVVAESGVVAESVAEAGGAALPQDTAGDGRRDGRAAGAGSAQTGEGGHI